MASVVCICFFFFFFFSSSCPRAVGGGKPALCYQLYKKQELVAPPLDAWADCIAGISGEAGERKMTQVWMRQRVLQSFFGCGALFVFHFTCSSFTFLPCAFTLF